MLYSLSLALITSLRRVGALLLLTLALAAASAVVTGWLGGENVYHHGIGVQQQTEQP